MPQQEHTMVRDERYNPQQIEFSRLNCLYYRAVNRSSGQTSVSEMCAPLFVEDETGGSVLIGHY